MEKFKFKRSHKLNRSCRSEYFSPGRLKGKLGALTRAERLASSPSSRQQVAGQPVGQHARAQLDWMFTCSKKRREVKLCVVLSCLVLSCLVFLLAVFLPLVSFSKRRASHTALARLIKATLDKPNLNGLSSFQDLVGSSRALIQTSEQRGVAEGGKWPACVQLDRI